MPKHALATAILTAGLTPALAFPAAIVRNGDNDGAGSLRAALASGASTIVISRKVDTITVTETLEYAGDRALRIFGHGQTIDGSGLTDNLAPVLYVSSGADLSVHNLAIDAGAGNAAGPYSRLNQGGGKGIYVEVPDTRVDDVNLVLNRVSVTGTGNHGVHVSDCSLGDDCGGGSGGGGEGSPASIRVFLNRVEIVNNGNGKQDADGLRVDDRADGSIYFFATHSRFDNNGADGVELDEGNDGNATAFVIDSAFNENGIYCNVGPFDPADETDVCNDDGDRDVDDAFDVDEAGNGSIYAVIKHTDVIDNFDEGLDFDEEDDGGYAVMFSKVYAAGNEDEGIKLSEEGAGGTVATLHRVDLVDNNGGSEDTEIEEADGGDVRVTIIGSYIDEAKIEQEDEGTGTVRVIRSTIVEPLDLEGVEEI